jgi:hypothetical protein
LRNWVKVEEFDPESEKALLSKNTMNCGFCTVR